MYVPMSKSNFRMRRFQLTSAPVTLRIRFVFPHVSRAASVAPSARTAGVALKRTLANYGSQCIAPYVKTLVISVENK